MVKVIKLDFKTVFFRLDNIKLLKYDKLFNIFII